MKKALVDRVVETTSIRPGGMPEQLLDLNFGKFETAKMRAAPRSTRFVH